MLGDDTATGVVRLFASRWWVVLLRGIIAIAFGVAAFAWPAVTVASLVLLFGWYAFIDGVFSLGTAIGGRRDREHRWWLVLEGIVGIWLGVVTLRAPAVTALMLVFFISIWAMTTGLSANRRCRSACGKRFPGSFGLRSAVCCRSFLPSC